MRAEANYTQLIEDHHTQENEIIEILQKSTEDQALVITD